MAVTDDGVGEHAALEDVGRGVTEVEALVGYVDSFFDVLAGENMTTPAVTILSITDRVTDEDAAPTMTSEFWARRVSTVPGATPVLGVARVTLDVADRLAEHAAGVVDLLDRQLRRRRTPAGRGRRVSRSGAAGCRR